MNKKLLALAALALITTGAKAKVKLPHILGDNMIIQQDSEANLWGWDKPGTTGQGNHFLVFKNLFCPDGQGRQVGCQGFDSQG